MEANNHSSPKVTMESDEGKKAQANPLDNSKPSEPHGGDDDDDKKSEITTLVTRSLGENIADHLALLELRNNVASAIYKVDSLDQNVTGLVMKIDHKVTVMNLSQSSSSNLYPRS